MTQQTYSTNPHAFIEEMEQWENECFPLSAKCPLADDDGQKLLCSMCPFFFKNRQQFINQLKAANLLGLNHEHVSEVTQADEKRK